MGHSSSLRLDQAPVGRLLFQLALPTISAQVVNALYNLIDRMFIGRIPGVGSEALTGVGITFPILMAIAAFAALVASGGAPRASIASGARDLARAEEILGQCTTLLVLISLVLTGVLVIFGRPLLLAFGASGQTVTYGLAYLQIYALGTVFVQLTLGLNAFITAQGQARMAMLTVILGAGLNVLLDPLFIFVFHLGVRGAALATVLSQACSTAWVLWFFLKSPRCAWRLRRRSLRLSKSVLLPCLALGVSPFIMNFTEAVLAVCFNTQLQRYGGDLAVGSMTVLASLMMLYVLPIVGLTQGSQPIIGFNYGAHQPQRVRQTFRYLLVATCLYSAVFWLLAQTMPALLIRLFTDDPVLIAHTLTPLRIYFGCVLLMGLQIACQNTFVALGVARQSLFLAILRKLCLLIPLIFLLPKWLSDPVKAVFWAEPISDFIAVLVTCLLFFTTFRRMMLRMESERPAPSRDAV